MTRRLLSSLLFFSFVASLWAFSLPSPPSNLPKPTAEVRRFELRPSASGM